VQIEELAAGDVRSSRRLGQNPIYVLKVKFLVQKVRFRDIFRFPIRSPGGKAGEHLTSEVRVWSIRLVSSKLGN